MSMLIEMQNIQKIFRTEEVETSAIDGVSLQVDQGEFVSIMGPSGCGKSTLLAVLGLIDRPDGGEYRFNGTSVIGQSERHLTTLRKDHIGFVFQSFNLIDELTVFENVELPLVYAGKLSAAERRAAVEAVLAKVDMAHRINHYPRQLSGGQQQRVAVARAIVNTPDLILADEPTGNLDSEHGDDVMAILSALNAEGTTVVMVTHSEECAQRAGRIVRLKDGRVEQAEAEAADAVELS
jgi:putative ABC transport system ATP-binding protein